MGLAQTSAPVSVLALGTAGRLDRSSHQVAPFQQSRRQKERDVAGCWFERPRMGRYPRRPQYHD